MQVSRRKVSEAFLYLEASKGDKIAAEIISNAFSSDDDFFREYRTYANSCKSEGRVSPVLVYTIGVPGDDQRHNMEWRFTKISLEDLYSRAIGRHMQAALDEVQGNLKRFAAFIKNDPCRYPEFNLACYPEEEKKRTVIGVFHSTHNRQGEIELIDAAHRTVSMLANGISHAPAYIGYVKPDTGLS